MHSSVCDIQYIMCMHYANNLCRVKVTLKKYNKSLFCIMLPLFILKRLLKSRSFYCVVDELSIGYKFFT